MTEAIRCRRCGQHLAVEREGWLYVGAQEFDRAVLLRCRICARETAWLWPAERRRAERFEVEATPQPVLPHYGNVGDWTPVAL